MSDLTILALDCSSKTIGLVLLCGARIRLHDTWRLTSPDIAQRCRQARELLANQLAIEPDIDITVIEAPVFRYASACIQQSRVAGALLSLLAERGLAWVEVAPAQAKAALCGSGRASKRDMIAASGLPDEHQADSYGLALAAQRMRIEKVAA